MSANTTAHTPDIVLVRRAFQTKSAKHVWWVILATVIFFAVAGWLVLIQAMPDGADLMGKIAKFVKKDPWKLLEELVKALVVSLMLLAVYVQSREKIVISAAGIAFKTPIPPWFPEFITSWALPWSRIKKAEIRQPMGTPQPALFLADGVLRRKILFDAWVNEGEKKPTEKPSLRDIFRYQAMPRAPSFEEMKTRAEASPLIQALRAHQVPVVYSDKAGTGMMFDLQSHPRTNFATAVFLGLLAYAFVDTLYIDETYVGDYPEAIWIGSGLVAAFLMLPFVTNPKIPRIVSIGMAAMIGFGVAVAMYPGLLRLNQLTDSAGLVAHEYVLRDYVRLVPVESDLPEATFDRYLEYFSQFPLGSPYRLYLRHGGLGFYQLDETPLLDASRAYYENKNTKARESKRR